MKCNINSKSYFVGHFIIFMSFFLSILLILTSSNDPREYQISEIGFSKFDVRNGDVIKASLNNGNYVLYLAGHKSTDLEQLIIDGIDINLYINISFMVSKVGSSIVIQGNDQCTIKFKTNDDKTSTINLWLIPSTICTGNINYAEGSPYFYVEFNTFNHDSQNSCLFMLEYTNELLDIRFGYNKNNGHVSSIYTNNFEKPALTLSTYNEKDKHKFNAPFLIRYDKIQNEKFIFKSTVDSQIHICETWGPAICTTEGCSYQSSESTIQQCSNVPDNDDYKKKMIIGIVVAIVVVVVIVVVIAIIYVLKKRSKKDHGTVNSNLLNSSSV